MGITNPNNSVVHMVSSRPFIENLLRIDIHQLIKDDHWTWVVRGYKLSLNPESQKGRYVLTLDVNNIRMPQQWRLSPRPIAGRLHRGGKVPWDKNEVWHVVGRNNKRYRFLYIKPSTFEIGTRHDHNARYTYDSLSTKQRIEYRKSKAIRRNRLTK